MVEIASRAVVIFARAPRFLPSAHNERGGDIFMIVAIHELSTVGRDRRIIRGMAASVTVGSVR